MAAERLQHAMKHLRARLRSESGQYETGLTATHRAILATVVLHGPVTAARIAELEHVSPQSVGQSLPELKARGLIRSDPDPDDGRKKLISADSSANELIESLMAGRSSFLARAIDQVVSPEEHEDLDQAIGLLERLASADLDGPPGTGCHASALKETSTGRAEPPPPPASTHRQHTEGASPVTATELPAIDPKHTALLVMDVLNGIVGSIAEPDALLISLQGAIADVRAAGGTIGYVRVAFTEDDWAAVPETNANVHQLAQAKGMHHEHESAQVHDAIAPQAGDITVRKTRIGGMSTNDLHQQLTARGIDTLILTGISTSGVVLSTLGEAADRDYRLFVLSDGVADHRDDVHDILLNTVFPSRATVIDSTTLHSLLQAA
jgi:nicotinamidase-related amidase/DNA-binding MarR family transcriptional regulator